MWVYLDEHRYRHATNEIPKQRDRGAGIIASSILEDYLIAAIKTRFDRHQGIEDKLFKGTGPLSSLSAKIDLGLLLGLYTKRVHTMLHDMREVRNDFAHNPLPVSFRSQRDRCAKMVFQKGSRRKWNKMLADMTREKRINTTMFQRSHNPRTQFIRAVQAVTAVLAFQIVVSGFDTPWKKETDRAPQPTPPE
jgi:hypothetical protein